MDHDRIVLGCASSAEDGVPYNFRKAPQSIVDHALEALPRVRERRQAKKLEEAEQRRRNQAVFDATLFSDWVDAE